MRRSGYHAAQRAHHTSARVVVGGKLWPTEDCDEGNSEVRAHLEVKWQVQGKFSLKEEPPPPSSGKLDKPVAGFTLAAPLHFGRRRPWQAPSSSKTFCQCVGSTATVAAAVCAADAAPTLRLAWACDTARGFRQAGSLEGSPGAELPLSSWR